MMPVAADEIKRLIHREERMLSERLLSERDWLLLAQFLMPTKVPPLQRTEIPGQTKTSYVYDSEGLIAPTKLSANLQGNLVNPAMKWQTLHAWPDELMEDNAVQDWCEHASKTVDRVINASNFGNVAGEFLQELPTFGTGCMLEFTRERTRPGEWPGLLWEAVPIGTYCIAEDAEGLVDTLARRVKLTARAAFERWGMDIGPDLMQQKGKDPDKPVTFTHWIMPRRDRDPRKQNGRNMPWASLWIYPDKEHLVAEGGFRRNPIICTRWRKATGEMWGTGQGHLALPDVRTLNRILELDLVGGAMDIMPAIFEIEGQVIGELIWEPAARNYVRSKDAAFTLPSGGRRELAASYHDRFLGKIKQVFFLDQIEALPPLQEGPPGGMSEYEIATRYAQVARLLGPMYGRLTSEFLQPIVEGTLTLLWEGRQLPPPPRALQGATLRVQYEGPLARAQSADEATAILRMMQWIQGANTLRQNMEANDLVNWDRTQLTIGRVYGVPADTMFGLDVALQARKQRAEAAAAQAKLAALAQVAESAGKAAPMVKALQPGPGAPRQAAA